MCWPAFFTTRLKRCQGALKANACQMFKNFQHTQVYGGLKIPRMQGNTSHHVTHVTQSRGYVDSDDSFLIIYKHMLQ